MVKYKGEIIVWDDPSKEQEKKINKWFDKIFKKRLMRHVSLNEEDFKLLIEGKVVEKDGVQIALQDIGYETMIRLIYLQDFYTKSNKINSEIRLPNYYCPKCEGITRGVKWCENPCCPNQPCCRKPKKECTCNEKS